MKALIVQLDRDQRMQQLWAAAADMLDFLKDSGVVLDSVPISIVEAMMKQIYDCALFVREYTGRGFLSVFGHHCIFERIADNDVPKNGP